MRLASGLAALLLPPAIACAAAQPPAPQAVSASYHVYRNGSHIATINETFETRDQDYRIVSESHAVGLFALFQRQPARFVSHGRLTEAGLRPLHFEGKRGESDPRRVRAEFDWQAARLTLEHGGRTETMTLPRGTQDRLSFLYQFMFIAPGLAGQRKLALDMTNGRKLGHYLYAVQPGVDIDTPIGRMTTVHVVKQHQPDESGTELWLSPQHRFLPVRMLVQEEDGSRYDQVITKLEVNPSQP